MIDRKESRAMQQDLRNNAQRARIRRINRAGIDLTVIRNVDDRTGTYTVYAGFENYGDAELFCTLRNIKLECIREFDLENIRIENNLICFDKKFFGPKSIWVPQKAAYD